VTTIVSRATHIVDCRESMGLGRGGGLAQRGTISETGIPDIIAISMSPGRRHITKPICEITHGLRNEGFQVGVLVLNAGSGVPADAPESARGLGPKFGLSIKEVEQIARHKLAIIHLGAVKTHIVYKARNILRFVDIPAIVVSQAQVDYEDFARIGIKTRVVMPKPKDVQTAGTIVGIVTNVTRGQTIPRDKLNEIIKCINNFKRAQKKGVEKEWL
jgi:methyl-coenzyme M reductase subunit C